jgi:hypothetical protein
VQCQRAFVADQKGDAESRIPSVIGKRRLKLPPHLSRNKGGDIVTCRVARMSQDLPLRIIDLVFCCECGSSDLEVCYTSKTLGPHLCPSCSQSKAEWGTWKETRTRLPMKEQSAA